MSGIKEQLLEMGFTNDQVTLAIKHSSTLESAIEFISNPKQDDEGEILHENVTAASLQCDDCGRLFRDGDAATLHATKSSHQNFSESTSQIQPLTAEQKVEKLAMLKARLAEKRALKAEEEKKELIVKEKVRRSTGREIQEAKEKQLEIEMAKALKDKKQEKIDDLKAHNKIKAQIEQDKLDRQRKREELKSGAPPPVIQKAPVSVVVGAEGYKTCRIQLRIADQPNVLLNLNADAFFEDVYNEAVKVVQGNLEFVSTFPKRVYGVKDLKKSLLELGLVPSCSLIVQSVV